MLIVVENGDVEFGAQTPLNFKATRGGDVLEVDSAVGRGNGLDDADDLFDVGGIEHHRPGINAGKTLEENGFALHDRHGGAGSDISQAEHRGAV